jgi:hypothetical protein
LVFHIKERTQIEGVRNGVVRRIFIHNRDEITGGWKILRNEELHNLYFSPDIIRVLKSRGMRWAVRAAYMEVRN